jgi:hypothetical protein
MGWPGRLKSKASLAPLCDWLFVVCRLLSFSVAATLRVFICWPNALFWSEGTSLKAEKIQLMHIAICRLLEPYGYYRFDYVDSDGWPHYDLVKPLPVLKAGEQSLLMKEAIVGYFLDKKLID